MDTSTMVALGIAVVAFAGVLFLFLERRKTRTLKSRFGPEYDHAVEREGSVGRAEAALDKRQKRVANFQIRQLTREERDRYLDEWRHVQERFVDDPRIAVAQADRLVRDAMGTRGYPMTNFEQQAADLSVDHAAAVSQYRVAHEIALRSERGQATTEDLRLATQHFRGLMEEITETHVAPELHR